MPRRPLIRALLAATALGAAAAGAWAQPARGAGGGMATRSVAHYAGLERSLETALAGGDKVAIAALLDEAFQARAVPRDPLDRDAWIARSPHRRAARVHDVSVQEAGDIAVASFLLDAPLDGARVRLVVDVWRGDKLLSRTEAPAPGARPASGANIRE